MMTHRNRLLTSRIVTSLLWLAALLLLGLVNRASAESVFKCIDRDGAIAYQATPCAATQKETQIEIEPPPPSALRAAQSQSSQTGSRKRAPKAERARAGRRVASREPQSFECRAANGTVFYRHSACPKSIPDPSAAFDNRGRRKSAGTIAVSGQPLSRHEACRNMNSHARNEYDEHVSAYDHNLGRDPCRHF